MYILVFKNIKIIKVNLLKKILFIKYILNICIQMVNNKIFFFFNVIEFYEGFILMDDLNGLEFMQSVNGLVLDGVYEKDMGFFFCC